MTSTLFWAEYALVDGSVMDGVLLEVRDGRFVDIQVSAPGAPPLPPRRGVTALTGLVLPGLANAHSHAFHRALRGRTHGEGGSFWVWRERMYALAERLDPDSYTRLATAVYAEMALAGITCVGEFHYLHHQCGGAAYSDPNAMGHALAEAAAAAGLRLTLLDTCYLAGGLGATGHTPLTAEQVRFSDRTAERWAERIGAFTPQGAHVRLGAAAHSVRAVPAAVPDGSRPLQTVAETARRAGLPLHVHVSEQSAENQAALEWYGHTPTALLAREGGLGPQTTVVHATHLSDDDVGLLGASGTAVAACPTTEADLGDGIGPFPELVAAGSPLCLGSDQHATTDLFAEARAIELHERLRSGRRGAFAPADLAWMATGSGHQALGWPDAGRLAVGARADLVAVRLDSVRTAGARADQAMLAAGAADVHTVVVDGDIVVRDGRHRLGDVGAELSSVIVNLWSEVR